MENDKNVNPSTNQDKNQPPKKNRKALIVGIIAIILAIILFLFLRSCSPQETTPTTPTNQLDITMDKNAVNGKRDSLTKEEIENELNSKVKEGEITISMNKYPVFKDGTSEGNLLIVNESKNLYPQVVQIYLSDTDELIYQSGLIPIGSRIDSASLDVDLDKGTYDCYVMFNNIDEETGTILGQGKTLIEIRILE